MLRVGIENGRLTLTADFLARDALEGRVFLPPRKAIPRKEHRFEPIEELVATLDSHAAAAVSI